MKKFTKSILTALSLATATFSAAPQAAGLTEAATASKTTKEYKDGSSTLRLKLMMPAIQFIQLKPAF